MKRFKRFLALFLCTAMLCGCSEETQTSSVTSVQSAESTASESESSDAESTSSAAESIASSAETSATTNGTTASLETTASSTENTAASSAETSVAATNGTTATAADTTNATTTAANTTTAAAKTTAAKTAAATTSKISESDFSLSWTLNSSWESDGKMCGTYEVTLSNNSGKAVSGWNVKVAVPNGFEITNGWNGVYSVSGNTLTIKNESYNADIAAGGNTSFGFNYSASSEFSPENAKVNGTAADSESGSSSSGQSTTTPIATSSVVTIAPAPEDPEESTPVEVHGQLSVKGTQLVDQNGDGYQLRGMSTHGITWFPDFVNENAFKTLRDDWNTNVVRLAMYVDEWGNGQCYMQNKQGSKELLEKGVDICIKLGMYVIIDWHVLNPGDPTKYTDEAISFFNEISKKYADYPNIIYEIVNEPNGNVTWESTIKPYAEQVIPVIRKNDSDAVIIVGSGTWSQDIDQVLKSPLDYDNIMYSLHFYAATHTDWLRQRLETCVSAGLPVFVSEFGCCDASGNGSNDFTQTEKWLTLLDKYGISYCNWSLANKDESASSFKPSAKADGNWSDSDYSESGAWIRKWFRNH